MGNCNKKLDAGLISAYDGIRWGLKPSEKPVLEFFKKYLSQKFNVRDEVYIGVAGDGFVDLKLAYNLKKALKNNYSSKVSVDSILVNRHGKCCDYADFIVGNLADLGEKVRSEGYDIFICDVDNTVVKSYVPKENGCIKNESKFDRFGRLLFVRLGFLLFTASDTFLSGLGFHPRVPYCKSEDSLDCLLDSINEAGSFLIFNSSANPFSIKKAICNNSNYGFNFLYNSFI